MPELRSVAATRYVTPLREGGSLPAIVEADDDGLYVLKFRGAGQGVKALVAELIAGELARALGLPVPEIVLDRARPGARRAPSPTRRSRTCITGSAGMNVGLDFLPGSLPYDAGGGPPAGAGHGRGDRLARRAGDERRPHPAQPEPARLARARCG